MISDGYFWLALACGVPVYWLLPTAARSTFLAALSGLYLISADASALLALALFACAFYVLAPRARRAGPAARITSILVLSALGYLVYFKYLPQLLIACCDWGALQGLMLPLGISYFTFKLIHYAIEAGRGKLPAHGPADFACYMLLFPIFTAGPIERFDHFTNERERSWSVAATVDGLTRIAHGLIKKFVIGNMLLLPLYGSVTDVTVLLDRLHELPTYKVWGFFALSFLYLYVDFSAYSDIAIGASRLFGLRIVENFAWPILATDIGMFWKRWHMSLAAWCQSYIYLPLIGLTRNPYAASCAAFLAMGLWHQGSIGWIMWGLWHGVGVSCFVAWSQFRRKRKWRGLARPGWRWVGLPLTMLFTTAGAALPLVGSVGGGGEIVRVWVKMLGWS